MNSGSLWDGYFFKVLFNFEKKKILLRTNQNAQKKEEMGVWALPSSLLPDFIWAVHRAVPDRPMSRLRKRIFLRRSCSHLHRPFPTAQISRRCTPSSSFPIPSFLIQISFFFSFSFPITLITLFFGSSRFHQIVCLRCFPGFCRCVPDFYSAFGILGVLRFYERVLRHSALLWI